MKNFQNFDPKLLDLNFPDFLFNRTWLRTKSGQWPFFHRSQFQNLAFFQVNSILFEVLIPHFRLTVLQLCQWTWKFYSVTFQWQKSICNHVTWIQTRLFQSMEPFLSVFVENSWIEHWTGSDWLILLSKSPCSTHMYQWYHMLHHQKFSNVDHHEHGIFLPILERSRHNLDGLWRLVKKSQKKTDFKTGPPNPSWVLMTLRSLSVTFKWLTNEFTIVTSAFHVTVSWLFSLSGNLRTTRPIKSGSVDPYL